MEGSEAETPKMVVGVNPEVPEQKGVRLRDPKIKGRLAPAKRGLVKTKIFDSYTTKIFDSMFGSHPFPPKAEDAHNTQS